MTEVTVDNFEELLPSIVDAIRKATFFSIDTELSGLVASKELEPSLFDTVEQRYWKQRQSVSKFTIIQFGLTLFTREAENVYETRSFTFFLCPRTWSESRGKTFLFEYGSFDFHCDCGLDFNNWARQGIPFLNNVEEAQLRADLKDANFSDELAEERSRDGDDLRDLSEKISNWLANKNAGGDTATKKGLIADQIMFPLANHVNAFKAFAKLRILRKNFEGTFIRSVNCHLLVKRVETPSEAIVVNQVYQDDEDAAINYLIGFSRVFRELVESKKPLVGHNLMLDLMTMYFHFYNPLPKTLKRYKSSLNELFPQIYDTKCIFLRAKKTFPELKHLLDVSNLGKMYEQLNSPQFLQSFLYQPKVKLVSEDNLMMDPVIRLHDAGFDSFATGDVFLHLVHALTMKEIRSPKVAPHWLDYVEALKPFVNRINLIRARDHCLNIDHENEPSMRPDWLYVQRKKGDLSLEIVTSMMTIYGTVDIRKLGRQDAILAVANFPTARDIMEAFEHHDEYRVMPYRVLKHNRRARMALWSVFTIGVGVAGVGVYMAVK